MGRAGGVAGREPRLPSFWREGTMSAERAAGSRSPTAEMAMRSLPTRAFQVEATWAQVRDRRLASVPRGWPE